MVRWGDRAQSTRIEGYQIADVYRHTHLHSHTLTLAFFPTNVSLRFYLVLIYLDFLSHGPLFFSLIHSHTHIHTFSLITSFLIVSYLSIPTSFLHIFTPSYQISPSLGFLFQVSRFFTHHSTPLFLILFPLGPSVSNLSKNCPFLNLWLSFPFYKLL